MILGSKGQRSRLGLRLGLQKHNEGDRVAGMSYYYYFIIIIKEYFLSAMQLLKKLVEHLPEVK